MLRADRGAHGPSVDRYLAPTPRLREGRALAAAHAARAAIDVSDGLAASVRQLADASGVGARIDADLLPLAPDARRWFEARGDDPVEAALGSDDYELLVAVPARAEGRLRAVRARTATPLTCIGIVTKERGCVLRPARRRPAACPRLRPLRAASPAADADDRSLPRRAVCGGGGGAARDLRVRLDLARLDAGRAGRRRRTAAARHRLPLRRDGLLQGRDDRGRDRGAHRDGRRRSGAAAARQRDSRRRRRAIATAGSGR